LPLEGEVALVGQGLETVGQQLEKLGYSVKHYEKTDETTPLPKLLIDLTGSRFLRRALEGGVAFYTTLEAAQWLVKALEKVKGSKLPVSSVQTWLGTPNET
jgi:carbamoyl-phosphate synthase large subunit